jgi:signal transduction histidine kinase
MIELTLAFALGLALGALACALARPRPKPPAATPLAEVATLVSRASHDLRGAISPALLMVERLESHRDEDVRQAATVIAEALDRSAAISRATSAAVKHHLSGS